MPNSPSGLALSLDSKKLFVTSGWATGTVWVVQLAPLTTATPAPTGPVQRIEAEDPAAPILAAIPVGHTPLAPVLSPDGKTLYVCNRFSDSISVIDLVAGEEQERIPVRREPTAAAVTRDGRFLLVANHLPASRADAFHVGAVVSVIDTAKAEVVREFHLPNGSTSLKDLRISPDGKYAVVTHLVAQYKRPTADLRLDWMSANALTVIDLTRMEILGSTLLDHRGKGAANPWGLGWSADGSTLVVAHAGTHEVSLIDFPALVDRLLDFPAPVDPIVAARSSNLSRRQIELASYLPFFPSPRRRVKLPATDLGPRAVAVIGDTAYVANYFSDTLSVIHLPQEHESQQRLAPSKIPLTPALSQRERETSTPPSDKSGASEQGPARLRRFPLPLGEGQAEGNSKPPPDPEPLSFSQPAPQRNSLKWDEQSNTDQAQLRIESVPLGAGRRPSLAQQGEFYFHSATICLQRWQSCASCHPDGRSDNLNWDLPNDGCRIGWSRVKQKVRPLLRMSI